MPLLPAAADTPGGREAFEKGDYARAEAEWQSAADHGDPEAQLDLGKLYEFGPGGFAQNYKRAEFWYRKAADQDNSEAKYRLALILAVGGDDFPPDLAEAYKWIVLAAESNGVWGTRAAELKPQFDRLVGTSNQAEGKKRAAAWKEAHIQKASAPASTPAATPTPVPAPLSSAKCAGWPFPTLPCTEEFPAFPGSQTTPLVKPPKPAQNEPGSPPVAATNVPAPPIPGEPPIDQLNKALNQIECSWLSARVTQGAPVVSGAVSQPEQKARLAQLVARYFPNGTAEINVDLVPPPLCHSLAELAAMRLAGLFGDGNLGLRLSGGTALLHEGDLIKVEVHGPSYAVNLRIDYFSLGGQVLHLWPNSDEAVVMLPAVTTHVYGEPGARKVWAAGGAPFGTEFITVIATPAPVDLGGPRRPVEPADDYLRDLKVALGRTRAPAATPNITATLVIKTSPR